MVEIKLAVLAVSAFALYMIYRWLRADWKKDPPDE